MNNLDQQILQLKIEGRSRAEIALMLGLTERTVKDRLSRIYEKLGGYENTIRFYSSQSVDNLFETMRKEIKDVNELNELFEFFRISEDDEKFFQEEVNFVNLTEHVKDDRIIIIPLGDLHWGSSYCNRRKIVELIFWAKEKKNVFFILMGDLIECATRDSVGDGVYKQILNPYDQFVQVSQLFQYIKEKILGVHIGNHEFRIAKSSSFNPCDLLARFLETKYLGFSALNTIKIGDNLYDIATTHGTGGSRLPHIKLKKVIDFSQIYLADIYCMGHVHERITVPTEIKYRDGMDIKTKKRHFLLTGHFLEWKDSYAEMAMLLPSQIGVPIIELNKNDYKIKILT